LLLPLPLLLGLLVVAANCELLPSLPGASSLTTLLSAAPLLVVPTLLAVVALRAARRNSPSPWQRWLPASALLRLSAIATPVVVHAFWQTSQFGDWLDRLAWDSHLGRMVLAMLPVYLAELPRIPCSTLAGSVVDVRAEVGADVAVARGLLPVWVDVAEFARMRLGGPLLVAMPLLLLGALLDLLQLDRSVYTFVVATAPGVLLGTLAFLLVAVAVLPRWFRVAFAVRPLPEPIGTRLRATAAKLGFPPQRLWLLPTGMRALNAMLVGPLPFGRCLCLTDGLVRELDADALSGVVAHEVGHAQRGHPAILIGLVVIVPLALLLPMRTIDFDAWDVVVRASALLGAAIAAWFVVRTLAHRFEHEADAASVAALGAAPCSRALLVVSRLAMPVEHGWFGRMFTLHPDEPSRWQRMRRYEGEPAFRSSFERQGRWLRIGVLGVLAVALVLGAFGSRFDWPYEQVIWRLSAGDHASALQSAQAIGDDVPARWQRIWRYVREDLAVAAALAPATAAPSAEGANGASPASHDGWSRGEDVLLSTGPAAARPWFAMVLSAADEATAVQRAVLGYCDAAAEGDTARMAAIATVVREIGVPPRLERVFAAPQ
jgi:Zn-dependent protease with chaperone function